MNKILTDYIAAADISDVKLRVELTSQIGEYYTERVAQGADEEFAAKQLAMLLGEPESLGKSLNYERFRRSGRLEVFVTVPIALALLIVGIINGAVASFSPIITLISLVVAAGVSALLSTDQFTVGKMLRNAQIVSIVICVGLFVVPLVAQFFGADLTFVSVNFDRNTALLPDGSDIPQNIAHGTLTLLYSAINFAVIALAKLVIAIPVKEKRAVQDVLHIRFADRMI